MRLLPGHRRGGGINRLLSREAGQRAGLVASNGPLHQLLLAKLATSLVP